MNTKLSFAVLMIATIVTACAPTIVDSSAPIVPAVQHANPEISAVLPLTGGSASTTARAAQEPRLWSGEVFLSENDNPDLVQNAQPDASQNTEGECRSGDSLPRRHGGCME